jgi:hypothetical protein
MGRPRIYANDAERQRAFRARRRLKAANAQRDPALDPTLDSGPTDAMIDGAAPEAPVDAGAEDAGPTIWEIFEEIWGSIPAEEFEKLPKDLSTQLDHYIYGLPKREP